MSLHSFSGSLIDYDFASLVVLDAVTGSAVATGVITAGLVLVVPETAVWLVEDPEIEASAETGILLAPGEKFDLIVSEGGRVSVRAVDQDGPVKILPARRS
ncbi:MAG TPA: hypothetical protein VNS22_18875 [Geminicoccus sp.]|uniref:hypothetical protein n=1 Tax=Geminicoccus sp. TaxID=2024832 RepID=UPI002C791E9F|nr:hypothetical protein [Geminicoccus sp.]HWL70424.1 hypothetical protein [Geminicoccus sp.]